MLDLKWKSFNLVPWMLKSVFKVPSSAHLTTCCTLFQWSSLSCLLVLESIASSELQFENGTGWPCDRHRQCRPKFTTHKAAHSCKKWLGTPSTSNSSTRGPNCFSHTVSHNVCVDTSLPELDHLHAEVNNSRSVSHELRLNTNTYAICFFSRDKSPAASAATWKKPALIAWRM